MKQFSEKDQADVKRFDSLKSERSTFDTIWQNISDYVIPRKSEVTTSKTEGFDYVNNLYDMTAAQANMTLAAGIMTNAVPPTESWFAFTAPERILNNRTKRMRASAWFQDCTGITEKALAASNFYTEFHEAMLDRNAFATCAIYTAEGRRSLLNFRSLRVATYVIEVDNEGFVDTVIREFEWTKNQAIAEFGPDGIGPVMAKEKDDSTKKFKILHVIKPRRDRIPGREDPENMPIESKWLSLDEKVVLRNSGFAEMPIAVSRFLRWGDRAYGWGPGIQCLPIVRQLNFLEQKMDILAEKAADPPVLIPEGMIDEVDFRAGGETAYDPNINAKPEEWMTSGRYDYGIDRVDRKQKFVRECFHNELFQMFANLERQITATEAMARLEEKLDVFSPTFQRITTELLQPILGRCFSILFRAGVFPQPPAEAFIETAGGFALPIPEVVFTSKLALALRAKENGSLLNTVNALAPLVQADPTIMDVFDVDTISRDVAHNNALPTRWLRSLEEVNAIRTDRAEQQRAMAQMQMAQMGAAAAKDMGEVPEDMREQIL